MHIRRRETGGKTGVPNPPTRDEAPLRPSHPTSTAPDPSISSTGVDMALRRLAQSVAELGLRCGAPLLSEGSFALRSIALRGYATGGYPSAAACGSGGHGSRRTSVGGASSRSALPGDSLEACVGGKTASFRRTGQSRLVGAGHPSPFIAAGAAPGSSPAPPCAVQLLPASSTLRATSGRWWRARLPPSASPTLPRCALAGGRARAWAHSQPCSRRRMRSPFLVSRRRTKPVSCITCVLLPTGGKCPSLGPAQPPLAQMPARTRALPPPLSPHPS